ncbi:unnamed protein product [Trichogramma brassicae]|uniref:Uncharacterized protein n=1 Tax=Trichogramma brassicae TaxID=86971 RepID=A0A6H5IHC1_9HYME|nr:unnamed protein product [Trichogramma brassicae]
MRGIFAAHSSIEHLDRLQCASCITASHAKTFLVKYRFNFLLIDKAVKYLNTGSCCISNNKSLKLCKCTRRYAVINRCL